jgi:hypothetical protein
LSDYDGILFIRQEQAIQIAIRQRLIRSQLPFNYRLISFFVDNMSNAPGNPIIPQTTTAHLIASYPTGIVYIVAALGASSQVMFCLNVISPGGYYSQ